MFGWIRQVINAAAPIQFISQVLTNGLFGETMDRSQLEHDVYARLAQAAYGDKAAPVGYSMDKELSNANASTFVNDKGHAVVAYRGTNPGNADDLEADLHIVKGSRKHKRFDEAVDLAKRARQKYSNVEVTGHSLGGTQALHVNKELGLNAHAYNPGATLGDKVTRSNVRVVRDNGDLVSKALNVGGGARDVRLIGRKSSQGNGLLNTLKNAWNAHRIF